MLWHVVVRGNACHCVALRDIERKLALTLGEQQVAIWGSDAVASNFLLHCDDEARSNTENRLNHFRHQHAVTTLNAL